MTRILVVDDEPPIRDSLKGILSRQKHAVLTAENGGAALALLERETVDLIFLDIKMPGMDGLEVLEKLRERDPDALVIMISAHGSFETGHEATKRGAYDCLEKPLDLDRVLGAVKRAAEHLDLRRENHDLKRRLLQSTDLKGESAPLVKVRELIQRVAPTDARVLITGENGTGKERVARLVHELSPRASRPFVDLNCAALPGELIESELFGHEEGAFTGAKGKRAGRFENAHGGTLFLDEVGDLPPAAQAKVLRALEQGVVRRVGGDQNIEIDVRVVAATNRDLTSMVAEKSFREDLFYRLNVFPIQVPPLRDRGEDVALLAGHFLVEACRRNHLEDRKLSTGAVERLKRHAWPGNVRELKNVMERLAILVDAPEVGEADVGRVLQPPAGPAAAMQDPFVQCKTYEEFRDTSEKMFLSAKLKANDWNISRTADEIGMPRSGLYKRLEKYGLK